MKFFVHVFILSIFSFSVHANCDLTRAQIASYTDRCVNVPNANSCGPKTRYVRVAPTHFMLACDGAPIDCPFPGGGIANSNGFLLSCYPRRVDIKDENPGGGCTYPGSIVQATNQVVGETIPVIGAPFDLVYFSNRVIGRQEDYIIRVPVTGIDLVSTVTNYNLQIKNENNVIITNTNFIPVPNLTHTYQWDGLNASSVETWAKVKRNVILTETATDYNFPPGVSDVFVGSLKAKKLAIGAWVPNIWHYYDALSKTLFKGDGTYKEVSGVADGSLIRIADESGKEVYYFDSTGKITQTKTGLTGTTIFTFAYDTAGRLKTITQPFSRVTTFTRNTAGVLLSIKAPNNAISTVVINSNGYLAEITNPKLETYLMTYYGTTGGLLHTFTKPNGNVTTLTYDSLGNLISDSHNDGYALTLNKVNGVVTTSTSENIASSNQYSISSKTETHNSPSGVTQYIQESDTGYYQSSPLGSSQFNYIPNLRFGSQVKDVSYSKITNFGSRTTNYTKTANLTSSIDPFSITTLGEVEKIGPSQITSNYDSATKIWTTTTKLGKTTTRQIDIYERPVLESKGTLTAKVYTYSSDLLTKIAQGARSTTFTYHTNRLLKTVKNSLNQITSYTYDSAERPLTKTLPDLRVINYTYDSNGNLTSITPPGRPVHTLTFGLNEKLEDYAPPAVATIPVMNTDYEYNLDKKITKITRPDGKEINFSYDPTSGLLDTTTGLFGTIKNNYSYGLLSSVLDQYGTNLTMFYTGKKVSSFNLKMGSTPIYNYSRLPNSTAGEKVASETFNGAGTSSISRTIAYTYDDDEYLTGAGEMTLAYNTPNGQLVETTLLDVKDTYGYNAFGEIIQYVVKKATVVVYQYDLIRDTIGRVTQKTEILNGVTTVYNYIFDTAGRLITVKTNGVITSTYTYDSNSNRNGGTVRGVATTASYDDQDRLTTYNGITLAYNDNGELLTKGTATFAYDIFGNLKQYVNGATNLTYEVDPFQRRLGQVVNAVAVSRVRYVYNPEGKIIGELDYQNKLQKAFIYATKGHVPDYFIDSSNNKFKIITDHLGSVRVVLALSTGVAVQIMKHDEFGAVLQDTNPGFVPFGFAGGIYNNESGLVRFGARDYDSQTGRWTAKDPIKFEAKGTNLYGYVLQDPINFVDPYGKDAIGVGIGVIEIVVGGGAVVGGVVTGGIGGGIAVVGGACLINDGVNRVRNNLAQPAIIPEVVEPRTGR